MARVTLPVVLPSVVDELEVFNLPNPASGKRQFYGQDKSSKRLYELIQVDNGTPRSWLFEKRVQSGAMTTFCPDDDCLRPRARQVLTRPDEQFTTADNIFHDPENPAVTRLEHVPQLDAMLSLVCDAKGDDDFRVYRINDAKLLQWLIAKLDTMADGIAANEVCLLNWLKRTSLEGLFNTVPCPSKVSHELDRAGSQITPSGVASASFKAISTPSNVTARQRYSYAAGIALLTIHDQASGSRSPFISMHLGNTSP
ncbi:uncharacterized protein MONBRDRAFT_7704 [Monosiga brevicollis MX1]|uniref:Ribonuclease H2 subunit B n=1 Tax=Monosiga brevicollis TaxID=81824 RepID=A9UY25_MONBE|nr:uncharacterized protein MONBRDRAFT_7704 [Monosiga brevicollis MX1]EDQ89788.1 predicted protein [Monosiga brevicollis MX1]|eukprot:XP_001745210.1 hypothetical protein [Monosiga brevicollis MX1]